MNALGQCDDISSIPSLLKFLKSESEGYLGVKKPRLRLIMELFFFDSGFQLYVFYRFSRYFYLKYNNKRILWLVPKIIKQFGRILTGSSIHPAAKIGRGFTIAYGIGIVIGSHVRVGNNVAVYSGVSLGSATPGLKEIAQPEIGDNVMIGTGAKVLGGVKIGSNVKIGANSVVLTSFGSGVTIAGIPAKAVNSGQCTLNC